MTSFSSNQRPVALYGAGSWGTALAFQLARQQVPVHLWTNEADHAAQMASERCNRLFLPGHPFPDLIQTTGDFDAPLEKARYILIAVPSNGFRGTLEKLTTRLKPGIGILWATKGLDTNGEMLHTVAKSLLGDQHPFAILSGPSFAREVAIGLPTAVVIATEHVDFGEQLAEDFNNPSFRTYPSTDLAGVGTGGVVKNVLAIATGISDGMQLGANARCALITRGLAEMTRLGLALGALPETFTGLACLGDLVLTATDDQSRNRRLGLAIGKGATPDLAEKEIGQVVEGKHNARQLTQLAKQQGIEMPITEKVWDILQLKISAADALKALLSRSRTKMA